MTSVTYDQATRIYEGTDLAAVDKLTLEITEGELLVLVGPSGSGKSTALRMLAGLEPLDEGRISIGDRDVSNVRPRDRDNHEPDNLFVAGFIGSPAMNLVNLGSERPLRLGSGELALDADGQAAVANGAGDITLGFRPEALRLGDGPLRAKVRAVEDLGSEVFVHVALEHRGETLSLVSRMAPPFHGSPGDSIGLQLDGMTHLFGGGDDRLASVTATLA